MAHFVKEFGEKLLGKDGEVDTVTALGDVDAVGIYFSAHWCPPCRGFTPKFAETYNKMKEAGKKFEVVFVSSDQSEEEFKSYHAEMPWLALKFDAKDLNDKLNSKHKCEGIPYLVILDGKTGEVNSTNGRALVSKPDWNEKFPWKPIPMSADALGTEFLKGEETVSVQSVINEIDVLGIYFSAHWCPPCKSFTPVFAEKYKALKDAGKKFEVIFASSDKDETQFKDYYKEMPWLALPYDKRSLKEDLAERFECQGIPYLVFIDTKTWKTITTNGRGGISSEDCVEDFPFHPKPLYDLSESMEGLMNSICFICFNDYADKDVQKQNKGVILPIATAHKELGDDDKIVQTWFTAGGSSGIEAQMRPSFGLKTHTKKPDGELVQVIPAEHNIGPYAGGASCDICRKFLPKDMEGNYRILDKQWDCCGDCKAKLDEPMPEGLDKPQMTILDFGNKQFWFPAEGKTDVTAENIQALMDDWKAGKLTAGALKM